MTPFEKLRNTDLNLLPVLRELLRIQNVTRTAETLNMSQSAASEALKRLRTQLEDELLVRKGRAMELTPLARRLGPLVDQALGRFEQVLWPERFDPAESKRSFLISTADSIILTVGPQLIERFAREAPGMSVRFVDLQWVNSRSLELGELDFVIMPDAPIKELEGIAELSLDHFNHLLVYEEEFVCIAKRGHPLLEGKITLERLDRYQTVAFRIDPDSPFQGEFPGQRNPDQVFVSHFSLVPFLVEGSDAVAFIPRHVAKIFCEILDIAYNPIPITAEVLSIYAFWASVHENDPEHRWLREVLREISPGCLI